MAGNRRSPPIGVSVRIGASTHARVVLACETLGMTVSDWLERSALASLERQETEMKIKAYKLACSAAEAARKANPMPENYGLPRDFELRLHP